jgi:isocitrate lyase
VPTITVARTDAESAQLITSDIDERDHPFIDRDNRTPEGFFRLKPARASTTASRAASPMPRSRTCCGGKLASRPG